MSLNTEKEKVQAGKTSLRTLFKSRSEKDTYSVTLQNQIEAADK